MESVGEADLFNKYAKRCFAIAYYILKNKSDAEEIQQDALIELLKLKRRNPEAYAKLDWIVVDSIRKRYGRPGTERAKFNYSQRFRKSIVGSYENEESFAGNIIEEQLAAREVEDERENSFVDSELIERIGKCFEIDWNTERLMQERAITDGRVSQLRKIQKENFVKEYLFKHYREYGIETEIEVDWISI